MITNTHLLFSRIIYLHCLKESNLKLKRTTFMYANIKPDFIIGKNNCPHTLNGSKNIIMKYSNQLIYDDMNIKKFSMILGLMCHYICDYFCIYHTKEYENKNIFKHIFYEIGLHIALIFIIMSGKLNLYSNVYNPQKNISVIISKMQKRYSKEKKSFNRDITYALSTVIWAAESVIYFGMNKSMTYIENEIEIYKKTQCLENII